jgi:chromosome segregation ATPase
MREHTDLEQQAEDLGKSVNGIREDCDAELKAIKESMSSMEHDYTAWAKEVESQRNTEAQMHSKISLLEDRLETSRQEVITLKARMYDMMHPGETGLDVKARLYEMEHEEGGDG